jgi:hypothetical protein
MRRFGFLSVVMAAAAFAVPAANAGLLDPVLQLVAPTCASNSYPFAQFGDAHPYYAFQNNGFESGTSGWTLSGAATIARDNEPWNVGGGAGRNALQLGPGASATSPAFCINLFDPAGRGFARAVSATGGLQIQVIFHGLTGNLTGIFNVGTLSPGSFGSWAPTDRFSSALALPLLTSSAQIRITNTGRQGSWEADDMFVDPCIQRLG